MEMGTIGHALLQDHRVGIKGAETAVAETNTVGAWSLSSVRVYLTWRSGDDVADGGHMIVPSMGQTIPSWDKILSSPAIARSGMAHITPMT